MGPKRIRWWAVTAAAALGGMSGCILISAVIFGVVRWHRGVPGVRFVDIVVPSRWPRFRAAQADHLIATAAQLAQQGKLREALAHARSGLSHSPAHRFGRLLMARLMLIANRPDAARQVLFDGLEYHGSDPAYLSPLLALLLQRQEDEAVVALANKLLPSNPEPLAQHRLVALAAATACFHRGHYDRAEDFLRRSPGLDGSPEGRRLTVRLDWDQGYHDLALARLRGLVADYPKDPGLHAELVTRLLQAGLADEARRRCVALQIAEPTLAAPRLALLHIHQAAQDTSAAALEFDALLRDFGDGSTLLALGEFAANSGQVALVHRVRERVKSLGLDTQPHDFLAVEALLVARDYGAALDAIRVWGETSPASPLYRPLCDSLQAVAYFGLGDRESARAFLNNFLQHPTLRAESLMVLAARFVSLEAGEAARQILSRAIALDPLNQAALTRLVELDLTLNRIDELPGHLQRLVTMRRPSPDLLRVAQHRLGSDLFLYSTERTATLEGVRVALAAAASRGRN